jgi:hypothetical protein
MSSQEETQTPQMTPSQSIDSLLTLPVTTENEALNVIVQYLNVAQHRGVFNIAESSKIFDCIKIFQRNPMDQVVNENVSK